jgi:rubrerythrin
MASLGTDIAPVKNETLADGIEFMESRLKTLKADLEAIRDRAMYALKQIEQSQEHRSMLWKCKDCHYIKHFTKPITLKAAGRCPRCKNAEFRRIV